MKVSAPGERGNDVHPKSFLSNFWGAHYGNEVLFFMNTHQSFIED